MTTFRYSYDRMLADATHAAIDRFDIEAHDHPEAVEDIQSALHKIMAPIMKELME